MTRPCVTHHICDCHADKLASLEAALASEKQRADRIAAAALTAEGELQEAIRERDEQRKQADALQRMVADLGAKWTAAEAALEQRTAEVGVLREALHLWVERFDGMSNGYCVVCKFSAHRFADTRGKLQPCETRDCISHKARAALASLPASALALLERVKAAEGLAAALEGIADRSGMVGNRGHEALVLINDQARDTLAAFRALAPSPASNEIGGKDA